MRRLLTLAFFALATTSLANDWGALATISSTMGVQDGRLCLGEASRGDIGCPAYAPSVSPTGGLTVAAISLTTAGTNWGYLGNTASYLPNLTGNNITLSGPLTLGSRLWGDYTYGFDYFWMGLKGTAPDAQRIALGFKAGNTDGLLDSIMFHTNGITRMVISSTGKVGIGTMEPSSSLQVIGDVTAGAWGASQVILQPGTMSNNGYVSVYGPSGARSGYFGWGTQGSVKVLAETGTVQIIANGYISYFQPNGNVVVPAGAFKPGGGSWSDSSDRRLKTNIRPIEGALAKLTQLQGVTFDWKEPSQHKTDTAAGGFVAQDVAKVFPEFIAQEDCKDKECTLTPDGKIATLGLPLKFDAYVVEAIKELKSDNNDLRQEVENLKQKINARHEVIRQLPASLKDSRPIQSHK